MGDFDEIKNIYTIKVCKYQGKYIVLSLFLYTVKIFIETIDEIID